MKKFVESIKSVLSKGMPKLIETATNKFSQKMKIGEGGFAETYRAKLPDGRCIAVKRVRLGRNDYFKGEQQIHGSLQSPCIVQLYGSCIIRGYGLLALELMDGTLEGRLNDKKKPILSCMSRIRVAHKVARALHYMHSRNPPIVHRDVKSENVLMKGEDDAKLADFGLSLILPRGKRVKTGIAGTPGYIDPWFSRSGLNAVHMDIYSFGVVLLEITSGKFVWDYEGKRLVELATRSPDKMKENFAIFDTKLDKESKKFMGPMLNLAIDCLKAPKERPKASGVVQVLKDLENSVSPPRPPPGLH